MVAPITGDTVVRAALRRAGITGQGRPPSAADSNNALEDFNDMIAQWNTQRWMNWNLLDLGFTSTGAATYTIGPAANFNTIYRPDRLEAGYVRQLVNSGLPVNTPLEIIPSREQFSRLSLPGLVSFPLYLFLDSSYPIGIIHPYPLPNAAIYEIHVIVKNPIAVVELATDLSILPPHYIPAFKFNLARWLRQAYGKGGKPDIELNKMAGHALDTVKQSNLQISELVMPKVLITQSSGYNILSDQFGNG